MSDSKNEPAVPVQPGPGDRTSAETTAKVSEDSAHSAEEQMALYEKDLKENDWGHQPC